MAERDQDNHTPTELITSKLRFYSLGIVAANKDLTSMDIAVTPVEELPMIDGELSDHKTDYGAKGKDELAKAYSSNVETRVTIKASWLRFSASNRMTAPDVRRGEAVMLYQFGDADKYYWVTLKEDSRLRKLETVIWAFSGTRNEDEETTSSNSYYLEVSTHKKIVHLHTSKADGEPFEYDIQINAKEGFIAITDDVKNYITLNSKDQRIELHNSSDCHIDMDKGKLTVTAPESITYNTPTVTVNADEKITCNTPVMVVNASESVTYNTPNFIVNAPKINLNGKLTVADDTFLKKNLVVDGFSTLVGGHAPPD